MGKTQQMMDNLTLSNSNPTKNLIVHCLSIFTALMKISGLMRIKIYQHTATIRIENDASTITLL